MIVIFLGAPASGKGSQAKILSEKIGLPHISTGDLLREEVKKGGPVGSIISKLLSEGKYVSDFTITALLSSRLADEDCDRGFILDGFPRTMPQVRSLDCAFPHMLKMAICLKVPEDILFERMIRRAKKHSREDDNPEVFKERLQRFGEFSGPVVDHYRELGILHEVDASGPIPEVAEEIKKIF